MEKSSKDEMSYEVCNFAHDLLRRGGNPLHVVQALVAGTLAFAGRIGEEEMRGHISRVNEINHSHKRNLENTLKGRNDIPF
jgi:hypothetical protein